MLEEAVQVIRTLLQGGYVNHAGRHFRVDSAKIWDLHDEPVQIGVAVSAEQSVETFAPLADHLIAVEPLAELVQRWDAASSGSEGSSGSAGSSGSRKIGQMPVSWDRDKERAIERAHREFRWFGGGWKVNAELPGPAGFAGATQFVRPEDVAGSIPCGDDVDAVVAAAKEYVDAGFTDLALVQIGDEAQNDFLAAAERQILPALRG